MRYCLRSRVTFFYVSVLRGACAGVKIKNKKCVSCMSMCDGKKGKFTLFKFILIKGSQEGLRHVTVVENMQYPAASAISRERK